MTDTETVVVHGTPVHGVEVDPETRCAHYATDRDVIAIRFACCGDYYPCDECHATYVDHDARRWSREAFDTVAVLCGVCGAHHTITAYRAASDGCPDCGAAYNPGCRTHHHRYFDVEAEPPG
jgi:uncharacterized CHY-type Zn-finger protein